MFLVLVRCRSFDSQPPSHKYFLFSIPAVQHDRHFLVDILVKHGANANFARHSDGMTPVRSLFGLLVLVFILFTLRDSLVARIRSLEKYASGDQRVTESESKRKFARYVIRM